MISRIALGVLMMCAASARADIVDSGNLVIGGTGTIQGNAFSVGGSTFSVAAGTVSVGGLLRAGAAGIQWGDNSVSTTACVGGGAVFNTTFTRITAVQTTSSTEWVPVTGATVTLTAGGGRLFMAFNCQLGVWTGGGYRAYGGFLVNGALIDGETSAVGFISALPAGTVVNETAGQWQHITESTYSGTVSVVPIFKAQSGATVGVNYNGDRVCQMVVTELR